MLQLGPLLLDPVALRVHAGAGTIRLRPKATALLALLASRPGETVLKDVLLETLWPGRAVEEKNVAVLVGEIRRALAPFLDGEPAIATIPGGGYRLALPVTDDSPRAPSAAAERIPAPSLASKPRVLVLPLRVASTDSALNAAAESIAASLTTRLAAVATVILPARSSAWRHTRLSGSNGVTDSSADLLVTGSAFLEGARIRINLHVLDALGRVVLWADQVTMPREQLFEAEDRLCERTAGRIAALYARGRSPTLLEGAHAPRLLHSYRLGCHFLGRRTAGGLSRARELFHTALGEDDRFAPAWIGLAQCWAVEAYYTDADPRTCAQRAVEFSSKALEIDPGLSQAFAASGFAYLNLLEWDKAAEHLRQALALDAYDVDARHYYSEYLTCRGRHDEAIQTMHQALQLDPTSRILNSDLGKLLMLAGRFDDAADQFRATVEMDPDFPLAHYRLGLALACQGNFSEARARCAHAADLSPEISLYGALHACCEAISGRKREAMEILHRLKLRGVARPGAWYGMALLHLHLGEKEVALDTLRTALEKRAPLTIYAQVDPLLDGLREMRGFRELDGARDS